MKTMKGKTVTAGLVVLAASACAAFEPLLSTNNTIVCDDAAKRVFEADAAIDRAWTACRTPAEVKARQQKVREALVASFGGYPERTPLNAVVTGRIQRDGYSIEKVMFESRPHHHVTANVFLPDPIRYPGRRPGVIVPCGHSMNGKASLAYQRGAVKATKLGLVVMVYDPIDQGERRQCRGDEKMWNCIAHNNVGRRAELLGWSTASFRIWDGMRALDYLETRADVDAAHLGVMGHSGGGTMTSWIMCLDDRVRCAAPSGYLSTMRAVCAVCGPQDAEQFTFGELAFGFNHLGHIVLRAPSPVLHCASHTDFFPFFGVLDTAGAARVVYATLGAAEAYRLSDTIGPHAWHESTSSYAGDWMNLHLQGVKLEKTMADYREMQYGFAMDKVDAGVGYDPKGLEEMRTNRWEASATPTGCTLDLPGERTVYDLMADEAARQSSARPPLTREAVRRIAGIREPRQIAYKVRNTSTREGVDLAVLVMDDGAPVPVRTFGKGEPVLYVTDTEKPDEAEAEARAIAAAGCRVTFADLRAFGETSKGHHVYYSLGGGDEEIARLYALVGVNLTGKRAEDAIAAAAYAGQGTPVKLIAKGRACVAAAHAAYVARGLRFSSLELREPPLSWAGLFADDAKPYRFAETVYGAWKAYDWTDLAAATK